MLASDINVAMADATDTIKKYRNPWFQKPENRLIHNQRANQWYHNHRDEVLAKRRQRFDCQLCGGHYTADHKQEHFRSKKHSQAVSQTREKVADLLKLLENA